MLRTLAVSEIGWQADGNTAPQISALAVIPLENLSRDPEQEYFADGMTDALITGLAKMGSVRVTSRTSIMRYKGDDKKYQRDWAGTECRRSSGRDRDAFW